MKTITRLLSTAAVGAMLALPAMANSVASSEIAFQDPCTDEGKTAIYTAFVENRKTDQAKAYDNAKKYLGCPTEGATEATQKIIEYLKKWVASYEEINEKNKLPILLYNERKYPEAYDLGMKLLAKDPENLKVLIDLGANGYLVQNLKNPKLNEEALKDAKKALGMLESGKSVDNWTPLSGKEEAIAYLNYTIGVFTLESDPTAALKNLLKSAQFESLLKKSPQTYALIGAAYENGSYAKLSQEYTKNFGGKDETPESKLALANVNQVVDRMIDAYARAVALATDPKLAAQKTVWATSLSDWYKYRHNKTTEGMDAMLAGILQKPLPPEPSPLTSLPTEPGTAPIGTSGATSTGTTASTTAPANAQSNTPTGTANKPTGTKPPATPAGPNKPKNN
jgi:tetratricopeptide (TPR) repeat protein